MALHYHQAMVHYLVKPFTYEDNGKTFVLGEIPAGSLILKPVSGVQVHEAFNAGSGNVADIGDASAADTFGSDLALGTAGFVPVDESANLLVSADTVVKASVTLSGTAASAGQGVFVVAFLPPTAE